MSSFHYDFILSKRSSLAKVWLAAHWEKKLSKVQIFETNLQSIVEDILHPKTPIALRTSSHLLVGLVRIYSRKAQYLLKDCSDTLVNIKVAFRPGISSLNKPVKQRKSVKEIMDCPLFITEKVDLLDQWVPEDCSVELDCTLNQSKIEEITLQEEPMKVNSLEEYLDDEGFGEMDADSTDIAERTLNRCSSALERGYSFADSAYGTDEQVLCETSSLTGYYSDPFSSALTPVKEVETTPSKETGEEIPKLFLDLDELEPRSDGTKENVMNSPVEDQNESVIGRDNLLLVLEASNDMERSTEIPSFEGMVEDMPDSFLGVQHEFNTLKRSYDDEEELVILDPIVDSEKKVGCSKKRLKRKLLIDHVISIERQAIFDNINNPSQILKPPVFAANTKRRMRQEEQNESVMSGGSFSGLSPTIDKLFQHSKSRKLSASSEVSADLVSPKPASEEDIDSSQTGFQNSEDWFSHRLNLNSDNLRPDVLDMSEQFIPLQDEEYFSDEESPVGNKLEDTAFSAFEFDEDTLLTEEQTKDEQDVLTDENISDDIFCLHVETTVLQSRPRPVNFHQIVGSDCKTLTRKSVARRFLKCLLMQRDSRLTLEQDGSFKEIFLHPGAKNVLEEHVSINEVSMPMEQ